MNSVQGLFRQRRATSLSHLLGVLRASLRLGSLIFPMTNEKWKMTNGKMFFSVSTSYKSHRLGARSGIVTETTENRRCHGGGA